MAVAVAVTYSARATDSVVSLGLYSEDPDFDYRGTFFHEIRATGATHVAVVVPWYQHDVTSTTIERHSRLTVPDTTVSRVLGEARDAGFRTVLFPILRVEEKGPGEWRGTLRPADVSGWWRSYVAFMGRMAEIATDAGAETLVVGSELSTMDTDPGPWRTLAADTRRRFGGRLAYSANWDHYESVRFWDTMDLAGVTGYFELTAGERDPSLERLIEGWREVWVRLVRFGHRSARPLVLTEVGYLSQDGTNAWPWKEGARERIDLEEQRMCFEAFRRVWSGEKRLHGAWIWNWFGWGGPTSDEYTPRGKPAAREIAKLFRVFGASGR